MLVNKEVFKWFVAHVTYRNESNVKNLLDIAGIEYYMPFQQIFRKWNDVERPFEIPVIPSFVLVKVVESDFIILHMMKELKLIQNCTGEPLSLLEDEMNEILPKLLSSDNPGEQIIQLINQLVRK